jgi:hypothetical protein
MAAVLKTVHLFKNAKENEAEESSTLRLKNKT